jgi:hypothetical protein
MDEKTDREFGAFSEAEINLASRDARYARKPDTATEATWE